ncbi:hypothetical protein HaLaN_30785 [Haematococcus lacustris]|uniref:Uncharacterized protein n=1 Tax=Haematococcus lacustris TaxID=44745 RepID=A0A6A0AI34_HAELA|nr:hypothetical protein HaLaN_30785 [Haematococcus lacustris]
MPCAGDDKQGTKQARKLPTWRFANYGGYVQAEPPHPGMPEREAGAAAWPDALGLGDVGGAADAVLQVVGGQPRRPHEP